MRVVDPEKKTNQDLQQDIKVDILKMKRETFIWHK
jgi:hypothetical protein